MAGSFQIIRDDISNVGIHFEAEALAIPASSDLKIGGECSASRPIFELAGEEELENQCNLFIYRDGEVPAGDVAVTSSCGLQKERNVEKLIHAVAPFNYSEKTSRAIIRKILQEACKYRCRTLALPLIGTGAMMNDKETVLNIFCDEIISWTKAHNISVTLVIYGEDVKEIVMGLEIRKFFKEDYLENKPVQEESPSHERERRESLLSDKAATELYFQRESEKRFISGKKTPQKKNGSWKIRFDNIQNIGKDGHFDADAVITPSNESLYPSGGFHKAVYDLIGNNIYTIVRGMTTGPGGLTPQQGDAVYIGRFNMAGRGEKTIIAAVGPRWNNNEKTDKMLLEKAVKEALELVGKHGCRSAVMPLISTGAGRYPMEPAICIIAECVAEFCLEHGIDVTIVSNQKDACQCAKEAYADHFTEATSGTFAIDSEPASAREFRNGQDEREFKKSLPTLQAEKMELEEYLTARASADRESFYDKLTACMEDFCKDMERQEKYEREECNLNGRSRDNPVRDKGRIKVRINPRNGICDNVFQSGRKFLSKLRQVQAGVETGLPKKAPILSLALSIGLTAEKTEDLLAAAGYSLSDSLISDRIVRWYLIRNAKRVEPDILKQVNASLKDHGCEPLPRRGSEERQEITKKERASHARWLSKKKEKTDPSPAPSEAENPS